jgi:hypothetical protein
MEATSPSYSPSPPPLPPLLLPEAERSPSAGRSPSAALRAAAGVVGAPLRRSTCACVAWIRGCHVVTHSTTLASGSPLQPGGFRLTFGLQRLLMDERGERGTLVSHGLHTVVDAVVPDGWHTTVSTLLEFTSTLPLPSIYRDQLKLPVASLACRPWPSLGWQ